MGYYDDCLEHKMGGWAKKNHKYISRTRKNGRWVYVYKAGNPNTENGFSTTYYDGPKVRRWDNDNSIRTDSVNRGSNQNLYDKLRKEATDNINKYGGRMDVYAGEGETPKEAVRNSMRSDKSAGKSKQLNQDAKVLRELKEDSAKAKVGKTMLKIKNIETIFKTKIKDIMNR